MRRNQSQNSNLRSTKAALPAYQRITSMANIRNIALPEFLRNENPYTLRTVESPHNPQICTPLKPKILQKYSKEFKKEITWKNFEDFYDFLIDANAHKPAVKIHGQEVKVQELLSIKNPKTLSTPVIELSLSVIKKKNREITKKSDEYPRILLSKVAFAEKLFKGQTVCTKINVLKYE